MRVTLWIDGLIHLKIRFMSITHYIYLHNKVITGHSVIWFTSKPSIGVTFNTRAVSISLIKNIFFIERA